VVDQGWSNRVLVAAVTACVLAGAACGRAPESIAPSPSADVSSSPAITSPTVTTPSSATPKVGVPTPSRRPPSPTPTSRTTPSGAPPPAPLTINKFSFHAGEVRILYTDVVLSASGGKPPYSWSVSGGAVPGGLALSSSGTMSGTPTAAGGFPFTLHVADSKGSAATAAATISVAPRLAVTGTCASAPCVVEQGCVTVCGGLGSQSGGVGPYTYTPQGTLPTGMGLSALSLTGAFPFGSWKFGVLVTDTLGATGSIPAAFDVFQHIAFKGGSGTGKIGAAFVFRIPYSGGTPGGTPKVAWKGILPPGGTTITVDSKNLVVVFSIPPQKLPGTYSLTVVLTDQGICGPNVGQHCTAGGPVTINVG
jgi:hypothetical protein